MKTVLVTGGAGYIGSQTCKALAAAGYKPVTYDNLCEGHEWAVKWGPFVKGDVLDGGTLRQAIEEHSPAAVIHFAAFAIVSESVASPEKYYRNNVDGTESLLDAMRGLGVNDIVFSSTCATYGVPTEVPISEAHPQNPVNPYGYSKLKVEQMLREWGESYGLRSCALRYFNAAGADPEGEIGEVHDPETHLVPNVLRAVMGKQAELNVYGTDYDTEDGTCVRDYIHVSDLADAHLLALEALSDQEGAQAYNLGTAKGHSVMDVIESVERVTGLSVSVKIMERRKGDPPVLVADASKAKAELGWAPKYDDIDTIVETAYRWAKSRVLE